MNRKNNRIKAQLVDTLLKEFNDPLMWVREITFEDDEPVLTDDHKTELKTLIRSKLDATKVIKLRLPLVFTSNKLPKNDSGILVDLKLNGPKLKITWKIAPNFGTYDWVSMKFCSTRMREYSEIFARIQDYIDLNYKQGEYQNV